MITDEKIWMLITVITAQYGQIGSKGLIPVVRNWLEENGLVEKEKPVIRDCPKCNRIDCCDYAEHCVDNCAHPMLNFSDCRGIEYYVPRPPKPTNKGE
jgi:hypothetical protein